MSTVLRHGPPRISGLSNRGPPRAVHSGDSQPGPIAHVGRFAPGAAAGRSCRQFSATLVAHVARSEPEAVHVDGSQPRGAAHFGRFAERAAQYAVSSPPAAGMGRVERFPRGKEAANRSSRRFPAGWPRIPPDLCRGWRGCRVLSGRRGAWPFMSAFPSQTRRACRAIRAGGVHIADSAPGAAHAPCRARRRRARHTKQRS